MGRVVVIKDVPKDKKDEVKKTQEDGGATVKVTDQGNGLYTVEATYPNGDGGGQKSLDGIDVHSGQGAVEWHRVAQAGNSFAFIRGAYGNAPDKMAVQNFLSAKSAGLACGLYHFYRVTRDPTDQADLMVDVLRKANFGHGDLPPVLDVEDNPAFDGAWQNSNNGRYIAGLRQWLDRMRTEFKCIPIIYTRASFWNQIGNPDGFNQYPLWVANYEVARPRLPAGWGDYAFWQYSESGHVDGVSGDCDVNHFNGDDAALKAVALS